MGDTVRVLGQGRQGFALARGAVDAWVVEAGARADRPEAFLPGLGRFALA